MFLSNAGIASIFFLGLFMDRLLAINRFPVSDLDATKYELNGLGDTLPNTQVEVTSGVEMFPNAPLEYTQPANAYELNYPRTDNDVVSLQQTYLEEEIEKTSKIATLLAQNTALLSRELTSMNAAMQARSTARSLSLDRGPQYVDQQRPQQQANLKYPQAYRQDMNKRLLGLMQKSQGNEVPASMAQVSVDAPSLRSTQSPNLPMLNEIKKTSPTNNATTSTNTTQESCGVVGKPECRCGVVGKPECGGFSGFLTWDYRVSLGWGIFLFILEIMIFMALLYCCCACMLRGTR